MTKEKTLMGKYMSRLGDPHSVGSIESRLDTVLRSLIGKTDDLAVGKCSHQAILERERNVRGKNPEHYCRRCGISLNVVGIGRYNDYLILRNIKCKGPICLECIQDGGDVFYQAFRKGLEKMKNIDS